MKRRTIASIAVLALFLAVPLFASPNGAALYKTKCASCHAADGSGATPAGKAMKVPDLRSDPVQKQTDLELTKVIAGGKGKMPAFGKQMSTPDIQTMIAFLRTLKPAK